ncbi:hypothetical protein MRX96_005013 [Rhipicephalus microplus]
MVTRPTNSARASGRRRDANPPSADYLVQQSDIRSPKERQRSTSSTAEVPFDTAEGTRVAKNGDSRRE